MWWLCALIVIQSRCEASKLLLPILHELAISAEGMRSGDGGFGIDGHLLDDPLRDP